MVHSSGGYSTNAKAYGYVESVGSLSATRSSRIRRFPNQIRILQQTVHVYSQNKDADTVFGFDIGTVEFSTLMTYAAAEVGTKTQVLNQTVPADTDIAHIVDTAASTAGSMTMQVGILVQLH